MTRRNNVYSIRGAPIATRAASHGCARLGIDVVRQARSGEVIFVGLVMQHSDGSSSVQMAGSMMRGREMVGACSLLLDRIKEEA